MTGLRERKARQARTAIFEAMLTLCEEQGYDATTVEQVAARADLGIATVYRYFPTKDAILLAPVAEHVGDLAAALTARPSGEDLRRSLARVIEDALTAGETDRARTRRLRAQLDVAAGPRARLWDLWHQQRLLLTEAVAARGGPAADPLWASAAAHVTTLVLQMALDHERVEGQTPDAPAYARRLLELLHGPDAPLPAGAGDDRTE